MTKLMHLLAAAMLALFCAQTSAFSVASPRVLQPVAPMRTNSARGQIQMGKMAKFGIFSPAVYAAKAILGEKELNKLRGKGISLHSQAITEWAVYVGAPSQVRGMLIKKAKTNGDTLGFLV